MFLPRLQGGVDGGHAGTSAATVLHPEAKNAIFQEHLRAAMRDGSGHPPVPSSIVSRPLAAQIWAVGG